MRLQTLFVHVLELSRMWEISKLLVGMDGAAIRNSASSILFPGGAVNASAKLKFDLACAGGIFPKLSFVF